MPWEQRGNQRYYYRKQTVEGRVVKTYFGRGEAATLAAAEDAAQAELRRLVRLDRKAIAENAAAILADLERKLKRQAELLAPLGYHLDRDGNLRKMDRRTMRKKATSCAQTSDQPNPEPQTWVQTSQQPNLPPQSASCSHSEQNPKVSEPLNSNPWVQTSANPKLQPQPCGPTEQNPKLPRPTIFPLADLEEDRLLFTRLSLKHEDDANAFISEYLAQSKIAAKLRDVDLPAKLPGNLPTFGDVQSSL
jgi:hypothetical protein